MSRPTVAALLDRLGAEGLLAPGAVAAAGFALREAAAAPVWYEELIAAVGAWLAAAFFLAFAFAAGLSDELLMVITGLSLAAAATVIRWWVARLSGAGRHGLAGAFVVQLALAGSVLARLLLGVGLHGEYGTSVAMLGLLGLEVAFLVAYPDAVQQYVAVVAASVWLAALIDALDAPRGYAALLVAVAAACGGSFLLPAWLSRSPLWRAGRPIAYGLATAAGIVAAFGWATPDSPNWPAAWALALLVAGLAWRLRGPGPLPAGPAAAAGVALAAVAAATQATPGIILGVGMAALGAAVRERPLMILGGAYVVAFVGLHYYDLDLSLAQKAAAMAGAGAVLLAVGVFLGRVGGGKTENGGDEAVALKPGAAVGPLGSGAGRP